MRIEKSEFTKKVTCQGKEVDIFDITMLEEKGLADIKRLPFSIKILVENLLRKLDNHIVRYDDLINLARWKKRYDKPVEIPYHPARVLMQDFTGVPAVVDLAAMRNAAKDLNCDPELINPVIPVDLVIDHSVQVDSFGTPDSIKKNLAKEYKLNQERYAFLKWGKESFASFNVVPPNSGICHQINLEHLGRVITYDDVDGKTLAYPDTLVGTDSHTTMINGIGVLGWGVGGIEAEAVMLGQPYYMQIPEVVGLKMVGELSQEATATDLVLTVTELLRKYKVVEKFVEFFGPGMKNLSLPHRATVANMSPEYGATIGFFPTDEKTINYLKTTHRRKWAEFTEIYTKTQGLFYSKDTDPEYTDVIELDLSTIKPSVAGPSKPNERIAITDLKESFKNILKSECKGSSKTQEDVKGDGKIKNGTVVIAAITSCTNTSNPFVMIGAGLLAKKAVEYGLKVPDYVKTSLSPGSRVVLSYLEDAALLPYFEKLGFFIAGFGCMTCIGNGGPLHPEIESAIIEEKLIVAAVLSGNRNFEARIHQNIKANFLASPMLTVAYALAGRVDIDLTSEPLGLDKKGKPVYLKDIWPTSDNINKLVKKHVKEEFFESQYSEIFKGDDHWEKLEKIKSSTFKWDTLSTYIKKPPYFDHFKLSIDPLDSIKNARVLLVLGDSVTTDHISPAGAISETYPAGQYLKSHNISTAEFNSYGSRRGNHEVMIRGTFGNIRIKNKLVNGKEGSFTIYLPQDKEMFVYEAAKKYRQEDIPLIVLAGKEYGTGSSRDWAAKGTKLLGIKAIIAESYERIHRSNLVGMGVLPLVFQNGQNVESLGLTGRESFFINGIKDMKPRQILRVDAINNKGNKIDFEVATRLDSNVELEYFLNGGILPYVLRKMVTKESGDQRK